MTTGLYSPLPLPPYSTLHTPRLFRPLQQETDWCVPFWKICHEATTHGGNGKWKRLVLAAAGRDHPHHRNNGRRRESMKEMCTRETAKYCVLDMRTGGESCLTSWPRNLHQFMEPNSSLRYSQEATTVRILRRRFPNCGAAPRDISVCFFFQFRCIIISNGYQIVRANSY